MSAEEDERRALIARIRGELELAGAEPVHTFQSLGHQATDVAEAATDRPPANRVGEAALAAADLIVGVRTSPLLPSGSPALRSAGGSVFHAPVTLGRSGAKGLDSAEDGRVSRQHAEVRLGGNGLTVVDLGSSNGTFRVRGEEVTPVGLEPVDLQVGDKITTIDDVLLATVVEGPAEE